MRKKLLVLAAVISSAVLISGCGSSTPDSGDASTETVAPSDLNLTAEVNPDAGMVVLPSDRNAPTIADELTQSRKEFDEA